MNHKAFYLFVIVFLFLFINTSCGNDKPVEPVHVHEYTEKEVYGTCTEDGYRLYTCSCGDTYTVDAPDLRGNHNLIHHEGKEATCTEDGYTAYDECSVCGYNNKQIIYHNDTDHKYIFHEAKEPTCTEVGWEEYYTCEYCDYSTYTEITLNHFYSNGRCIYCDMLMDADERYLKYNLLDDGTYEVSCAYTLSHILPTSFKIPETYNGISVTKIADGGFEGYTFYMLFIPDSVKVIGKRAFANTFIEWPELSTNLEVIEDEAFYNLGDCKKLTLSDNIKSIGTSAFEYCEKLEEIKFNDKLESIGDKAFKNCKNLKNVTLNNNLKYIGDNAFEKCYGFDNITIPKSVEKLGSGVFSSCYNLAEIHFEGGMPDHGDIFHECNDLSKIYLGSMDNYYCYNVHWSILNHPYEIYLNNELVESITIPNDITEVNSSLFVNCISIKEITISDSVISIGEGAFMNCSNLEKINFGKNVTSIGRYALSGCSLIKELTIPDGVTKLYDEMFIDLTNLETINFGNGIKEIPHNCCENLSNLKTVIIGNSTEYILNYCFRNCQNLENVELSNSIKYIGIETFNGCSKLNNIILPANLEFISEHAFDNCNNFKNVYYLGSSEEYQQIYIDYNETLRKSVKYYYSESEPESTGNYWHYNADNKIVIW